MCPLQLEETEMKVSMEMIYLPTMDLIYEILSDGVHCALQQDTNSTAVL